MNEHDLKHIIEATLLAAGKPITTQQLLDLFEERDRPTPELFTTAVGMLIADYETRGIELVEVASGWRIQVRPKAAEVVSRLWSERPAKYSRAFLETLALIAYRQPITRSEIEEIRGVSISSTIMRMSPALRVKGTTTRAASTATARTRPIRLARVARSTASAVMNPRAATARRAPRAGAAARPGRPGGR